MRKIILTVFLVSISIFNIKAQDIQAITNGFPIDIQNVPYQVSIQDKSNGNHFCGGSIINNKYILTAAHCVDGVNASNIKISVGFSLQNNYGTNIQTYNVKRIVINPNYNNTTNDFDLAVIEIDGIFSFNNFVQPIELISNQILTPEVIGNQVRVSGWGWTIPNQSGISNQLQAVDVPIINNQLADTQLDISLPNHPELTQRMICTGAVGMDRQGACHGDSGGPLVFRQNGQNDIQIGVVSWGVPGCAGNENSPSVYARISQFTEWIHGEIWNFINITGSELVCFDNTKTYNITNTNYFNEISWTSSSNLEIISYSNNSITVRAINSTISGLGWLQAKLDNGYEIIKNINIGKPIGYNNWNIDIHPYPGNTQGGLFLNNWTRVWVLESPGGNWNWTANYSMIQNSNSSQILIKPLTTGYLTIKARLENECGCGDWLSKNYYVTELSGGGHHFREND